jgi:hypothetical protein
MPLPTFLIIGAAKSGTTSLYHALRQHPDVFMPEVKEPRYFAYADAPPPMNGPGDRESNEAAGAVSSWEAYRALFATANAPALGEASVNYLYSDTAPQRIHERVPNVQLIAVLRNPIERAYSHYLHLLRSGREPLSDFMAALEAEDERVAQGWEWSWHYRRMGRYHEQLSRYLDRFGRGQLHVYRFADLKQDTAGLAQRVFGILGVDPTFAPHDKGRRRATGVPKSDWFQRFLQNPDHPVRRASRLVLPEAVRDRVLTSAKSANLQKPPLPDAARERLAAYYRDDVRRLSALLDRDVTDWLNA